MAGVVLIAAAMVATSHPMHTHAVTVGLPLLSDDALGPLTPLGNRLSIDRSGQAYWNAEAVSDRQLVDNLHQTTAMNPQPALWFEPDADAAYGRSAKVHAMIAGLGLTDRCFHFSNAAQFHDFESRRPDRLFASERRECAYYLPE